MRFVRVVVNRLLTAIPVLFLVSIGTFGLVLLLPGDPARSLAGGDLATPEALARVRQELNLDEPLVRQYWDWLVSALHLDLGVSFTTRLPVRSELVDRMSPTLSITVFALLLAILIGLVAGTWSGSRPGTVHDKLVSLFATLGVSLPPFVVAVFLVQVFTLQLHLLPAVGYVPPSTSVGGWLKSIILPSASLGLLVAGALSRQLRVGLVDSLRSHSIRTYWSIGSSRGAVVGKHALRNAAIPAVTVLGTQLTYMIGGTIIIEKIFAIQGVGTYLLDAAVNTDLPALRGAILWFTLMVIVINLLVDVALLALNPRLFTR